MNNNPYISFVIAARNDDYGMNFLHRMQVFANVLLELAEKYLLDAELIVVEWNPPVNKKTLTRALSWPSRLKSIKIRFITVSPEVHNQLPKSDKMPMFEFLAKNVGVRRAKGEYILATNPDIVFNDETIRFLADKKLLPECFYRIDRYDIKKTVPSDISAREQLVFCENNWEEVKGLRGDCRRDFPYFNYKQLRSIFSRIKAKFIHDPRSKIHTNASGDFFLMANSQWQKLRGYPELPIPSFIDSYLCFMAASLGLSQVILNGKKRIYHQGHTSYVNRAKLRKEYEDYKERAEEMIKKGQPWIINDENWGLGKEFLKEYEN